MISWPVEEPDKRRTTELSIIRQDQSMTVILGDYSLCHLSDCVVCRGEASSIQLEIPFTSKIKQLEDKPCTSNKYR